MHQGSVSPRICAQRTQHADVRHAGLLINALALRHLARYGNPVAHSLADGHFRRQRHMGKALKVVEKGVVLGAKAGWSVFNKLNSISPNESFTPKWSRQAAAEELPERKAAPRLAAHHRLPLPALRPRDPPADHRRQAAARDPSQREGRRNQGADHRARRPDPDGQGLPRPRTL